MTNLQNFNNKNFIRTVKRVRQIMPYLAVILLFIVYAVSAITEGVFLATLMSNVRASVWLAYAITISIQATRALLVFFPQLNPNRPIFGHQGEIIAIFMGLLAIGSILGLVNAMNLQTPVAVSLSILMLAGIGVEIFFLREVRYATELELYANRDYWKHLKDYYKAKEEFRTFLDSIKDLEFEQPPVEQSPTPTPTPTPTLAHSSAPSTPTDKAISKAFINALAATPGITAEQMKKVWSYIDAGIPEDHVLDIVNQFSSAPEIAHKEEKQGAYNNGKPLTGAQILQLYNSYKDTGVPDTVVFTEEQLNQIRKAAQSYNIDLSSFFPGTVPFLSISGKNGHV